MAPLQKNQMRTSSKEKNKGEEKVVCATASLDVKYIEK
jgi:hypothetical protein